MRLKTAATQKPTAYFPTSISSPKRWRSLLRMSKKFRTLAGRVKFWRILKVTWTKDSARAPFPGTYAAIDLVAQFANIDRDCGYIVVYQQADSSDFKIMRRENNYLDNATARAIEQKNSSAEVVKAWAQLSRHCPNYVAPVDAR